MLYLGHFAVVIIFISWKAEYVNSLLTTPPLPNAPLTLEEKIQILNAHNYLRQVVANNGLPDQPGAADMSYMQWHDDLANRAWSDAQQCVFQHTKFSIPGVFSAVGQNLASQRFTDLSRYIYSFFLEHRFSVTGYVYSKLNTSDPKFTSYGHYTQIVNANTKYVGCARYWCPNLGTNGNYILYCNYGPSGNYGGVYPYTNGPVCSRCMPDAPFCYQGLCISADTCAKLGLKCTCNNNCNNGTLDPKTCNCTNCPSGMASYFCDKPCLDTQSYCTIKQFNCPSPPTYYNACPNRCGVASLICAPPIPVVNNPNADNVQSVAFTTPILSNMWDITSPNAADLGISKPAPA